MLALIFLEVEMCFELVCHGDGCFHLFKARWMKAYTCKAVNSKGLAFCAMTP